MEGFIGQKSQWWLILQSEGGNFTSLTIEGKNPGIISLSFLSSGSPSLYYQMYFVRDYYFGSWRFDSVLAVWMQIAPLWLFAGLFFASASILLVREKSSYVYFLSILLLNGVSYLR